VGRHAVLAVGVGVAGDPFGKPVAIAGGTAVVGAWAARTWAATATRAPGTPSNSTCRPVTVTVIEDDPDPEPPGVCDETIIGVFPGPSTVSEGTTCLAAGAQVLDEVNVLEGAGLVATAAVIRASGLGDRCHEGGCGVQPDHRSGAGAGWHRPSPGRVPADPRDGSGAVPARLER
jgi:hypothetical protein